MKITIPNGGYIYIGDNDPKTIKIREGYSYSVDKKGELIIGTSKVNFNTEDFIKKLKIKSATLIDIQEYILATLENKVIK